MGKQCGNVACHDDEDAPRVTSSSKKEKGWNYTAIFLMMLFILPGFVAVVMQVWFTFVLFMVLDRVYLWSLSFACCYRAMI